MQTSPETGRQQPEQSPRTPFVDRHLGHVPDPGAYARATGHESLAALVEATVPAAIRMREPLDLPPALDEEDALAALRAVAARNTVVQPMIGLGYHGTVTPPVVRRNVLQNPAWYTAYTPYQPEISQGRLEALLTFQTLVTDLTGLDVANASLLDEPTAAAEAMTLLRRAAKAGDDAVFLVDTDVLPQTRAVLRTRAEPLGIELVDLDLGRRGRRARRGRPRRAGRPPGLRRAAAVPRRLGPGPRPARRDRRGRRGRAAGWPWPPTRSPSPCSPRPGEQGRRRRRSARCSASACPWATAARTPGTWPCATACSGCCPAAWSG